MTDTSASNLSSVSAKREADNVDRTKKEKNNFKSWLKAANSRLSLIMAHPLLFLNATVASLIAKLQQDKQKVEAELEQAKELIEKLQQEQVLVWHLRGSIRCINTLIIGSRKLCKIDVSTLKWKMKKRRHKLKNFEMKIKIFELMPNHGVSLSPILGFSYSSFSTCSHYF